MTDESRNRRRSWLDTKVSVSNIIWLLGLLVALGMFLQRFDTLEDRVGILERDEATMATKGEVATVESRLGKKIDIQNAQDRQITELRVEVARLRTLLEERTHR